jgi:hypothetical protein
MKAKKKEVLLGVALLPVLLLFFVGCTDSSLVDDTVPDNVRLPNPASMYCIDHDGELEIVDTDEGQVGYCILTDGTRCEEWDLYRGECPVPNEEVDSPGDHVIYSECVSDEDCVPEDCCHANFCVPIELAPDCEDVVCSMECVPGTLDCGQGACRCIGGLCEAVLY